MARSSARRMVNICTGLAPDLKAFRPSDCPAPARLSRAVPGAGALSKKFSTSSRFCREPSPFDRVRGHGREGEPTCGGSHVGIGTWSGSGGVVFPPAARAGGQAARGGRFRSRAQGRYPVPQLRSAHTHLLPAATTALSGPRRLLCRRLPKCWILPPRPLPPLTAQRLPKRTPTRPRTSLTATPTG